MNEGDEKIDSKIEDKIIITIHQQNAKHCYIQQVTSMEQ
jgi:hypothetical protein